MQISITGRHCEITGQIRHYAEEKAGKLPRFYDRVQSVEVIVEREGDLFSVEMIAAAAGSQSTFVAKEVGPDILACIDLLVDKLERQLTKHKEKYRNRKHLAKKIEPPEEAQ